MMGGAAITVLAGMAAAAASEANEAGWPCPAPPPAAPALGSMWPGQRGGGDWRSDPAVAALVAEIAQRNVALDDAIARIRSFAGSHADRGVAMPRVAAGLVDTIGSEQQLIVTGIRRFNARQGVLAKRLEQGYARRDSQAAPASASNEPDTAEEQMRWDTRIFEDRQRLLPVMCKLPSVLSERLTALLAAVRESAR
jgi:hypothetical protein